MRSDFMKFYDNDNVCSVTQIFCEMLLDIIDHHAPMKTKYIDQKTVPYMNSRWRKLCYQYNMLRNLNNEFSTPENYAHYCKLRNKCFNCK